MDIYSYHRNRAYRHNLPHCIKEKKIGNHVRAADVYLSAALLWEGVIENDEF